MHVQQLGCTPPAPPRAATSSLPLSHAPATRLPNFVFDDPTDNCSRPFIKSNTFSWYTSIAVA
jgi:hypothetical protein